MSTVVLEYIIKTPNNIKRRLHVLNAWLSTPKRSCSPCNTVNLADNHEEFIVQSQLTR